MDCDPSPASSSSSLPCSSPQSLLNLPLLFIDWDDTLLCSTFLQNSGIPLDISCFNMSPTLRSSLSLLETQVVALLTAALSLGSRIIIVTNAEKDWVQHSTRNFLPSVSPLLKYLQIVSARADFEKQFPDAPQQWKINVFQSKIQEHFLPSLASSSLPKNIISLGDSLFEREALRTATRSFSNVYTKSVKFVEHPSPEQLRRQVELVAKSLRALYEHPGDLDLMLTIAIANPTTSCNDTKPTTPPPQPSAPSTPHVPALSTPSGSASA